MKSINDFYHGVNDTSREWMDSHRLEWMSDDQWFLYLFLHRMFKGFHHIPTTPKECGRGIEINFRPIYMATFDYDYLTRLVVMSHNWCVRSEVCGSGPGMIKIKLWKRMSRDGSVNQRHPTIAEVAEYYCDL